VDMNKTMIYGRRVQVSGSASFETDTKLLSYAHELVAKLVTIILEEGGGLVVGAGKEPKSDNHSPSVIFDWTVLETAYDYVSKHDYRWPASYGPPILVVLSEKSETEIPSDRLHLWNSLLSSNLMRVEYILPGARSGALLRERQFKHGDLLITAGGGTGVEHLADLYLKVKRPVIPLDLNLGSSRNDGTGGSLALLRKLRENPDRFIKLKKEFKGRENACLAALSARKGEEDSSVISANFKKLVGMLARPYVFYTRLLNKTDEKFHLVESFFREVVDPIVDQFGYDKIDMEVDDAEHPFINVAVFENLHHASVVIADVTGERPNCYIELGYALGNSTRVIISGEEATKIPFDVDAIPCHFWKNNISIQERQNEFIDWWRKNIDRPSIIN
jgi:hypothetical protein